MTAHATAPALMSPADAASMLPAAVAFAAGAA